MTTYTASDFAAARFATHPDGRIAARLYPGSDLPWEYMDGRDALGASDPRLAALGFVPLSESLPSAPTEDMVNAARVAHTYRTSHAASDWMPEVLAAALAAAPASTTNEHRRVRKFADDWDTCVCGYDRWPCPNAPTTDEGSKIEGLRLALRKAQERIEEVERDREEAEKERGEIERLRQAATMALAKARAEARSAVDQHTVCHEQHAAARESLREANEAVKSLRNMTAREHRDAMWADGYRRADDIIPAGTDYMFRDPDGSVFVDRAGHDVSQADSDTELRLIDPPRPEGAEAIETLIIEAQRTVSVIPDEVADFLAERGVRLIEDGEGER